MKNYTGMGKYKSDPVEMKRWGPKQTGEVGRKERENEVFSSIYTLEIATCWGAPTF